MSSYDDLPQLIGKLKARAIEAYMVGDVFWRWRDGNFYLPEVDDLGVTGPDPETGEGGGEFIDPNGQYPGENSWSEAFDAIRSRVDTILGPWLRLPEPERFDAPVEAMRQACRTINRDPNAEGGNVSGGGAALSGNLWLVDRDSGELSSQTLARFQSRFLSRVGPAVDGHFAIGVVVGGVIAAEQELWKRAREDTATTVEHAIEACTAHRDGGGEDWKGLISLAKVASAAVSLFVSGGTAAIVLGAVDIGLNVLDGAVPPSGEGEEPALSAGSVDGILGNLDAAFRDLNDAIENEEKTLNDNLSANLTSVENDRSSYDLGVPTELLEVTDDHAILAGRDGVIDMDPDIVLNITDIYLPAIASELVAAADQANEADNDSGMWIRSNGIGYGDVGPFYRWTDLHYIFEYLLRDLAWETQEAAEHLAIAMRGLVDADQGVDEELRDHTDKVASGSLYDPWANSD